MASNEQSQEILSNILSVLQGIEKKLDRYEARLHHLEISDKASNAKPSSREHASDRADSHGGLPSAIDDVNRQEPRILYSEWHTNQLIESLPSSTYEKWESAPFPPMLDEFLDLRLSKALEARVGDCFNMPDDDRIPLKFFKSNILKSNVPWGDTPKRTLYQTKQPFELELDALCKYDEELRKQRGNDFVVIDFDAQNSSRLYRVGEKAAGPDLMVHLNSRGDAPWSRIILYQGATTGGSIGSKRKRPDQAIPYFTRNDRITGVWGHISSHLTLRLRGNTTNPYHSSPWTGFHTTFYEIFDAPDMAEQEVWRNGPLYDDPLGRHFRKCAYTLYSPLSANEIETNSRAGEQTRFWTILILSPSGFFEKDSNQAFPMQELAAGETQNLPHSFGKLSRIGAEMSLIGHGLERISERWASFQAYFDFILDSGNSLMQPAEHDNLLFDDGTFSRSRKYFWAIDCLGEFDNSISDNLSQWDMYKAARVPEPNRLPRPDQLQLSFAERQCSILRNQRDSFRQKLAATKALRDALFNASAVIESRASTRLGEHVKLLTFVSIFFLPLAFTTSLWSVNEKFSTTVLIYVIIIVALSTYFVMFNINSLARGFDGVYGFRKRSIVRAMKKDRSEKWKVRGKRFEVFRPKAENPEPSEWYIPLYALMHPVILLGLVSRPWRNKQEPAGQSESSTGRLLPRFSDMFRRRKARTKAKELSDEAWVM